MKLFTILGAIGALLSVAFGAFGAHALRSSLSPAMQETFETGVRYQMYHSLALFVVVMLALAAGVLAVYNTDMLSALPLLAGYQSIVVNIYSKTCGHT